AAPLAIIAEVAGWGAFWVFLFSALAVVPLAGFIGSSTEVLASHTGPRLGGLINATLGNAAELIITIAAVRAGLLELVKASITGSILGNLLLVLGLSMIYGGLKHGIQTFNRRQAGRNAILLVLAVIAMLIPSYLSHYIGADDNPKVETLSLGVAGVMILLYALGLVDANNTKDSPISHNVPESSLPHWSLGQSVAVLAVATAAIVWVSEVLVGTAESVIEGVGISEFFLGIILIPIIGNVAEHLVAVQLAGKNKMDLSVEIAVSSSLQIALFVAPLLVFVSLALGHPLQLIFNQFELLALMMGVLISALVSGDGESTWLEGAGLMAVYLILGLAFFLLP
ncbi:MAG: calcium/proton exchanger, partial [Chloroflexi bacterium]